MKIPRLIFDKGERFTNTHITIMELMDCPMSFMTRDNYSPKLISFHKSIKHRLEHDCEYHGFWCLIKRFFWYDNLPDYFLLLGIKRKGKWLNWEQTTKHLKSLSLSGVDIHTAPVIFSGTVKNILDLEYLVRSCADNPSHCGAPRKAGVIVRNHTSFAKLTLPKSKLVFRNRKKTPWQ